MTTDPSQDRVDTADVSAKTGFVEQFSEDEMMYWLERSFAGNTEYRATTIDGRSVLQATTDSTSSLFFRNNRIDLAETPKLSWAWKISDIYQQPGSSGFERTRSGDDFPARVYVVHQNGLSPTDILAINYVWSAAEPTGSNWANPFSAKSQMLVVESGGAKVGQWVEYQRDVRQDFTDLFGMEISEISGYAVMVDGDNSGQRTTSWFDYLGFSR